MVTIFIRIELPEVSLSPSSSEFAATAWRVVRTVCGLESSDCRAVMMEGRAEARLRAEEEGEEEEEEGADMNEKNERKGEVTQSSSEGLAMREEALRYAV